MVNLAKKRIISKQVVSYNQILNIKDGSNLPVIKRVVEVIKKLRKANIVDLVCNKDTMTKVGGTSYHSKKKKLS